jgi:hypothetical protein
MATTTVRNNTITISQTISVDELFESIIGSDFYGCTDYIVPRTLSVDESLKKIRFKYLDTSAEDENGYYVQRNKTLSIKQLAIAFGELVANNQTHCGNHSIADIENSDSCLAHLVLQQAIYGELQF